MKKTNKGFTLVELIVVVAVLALLAVGAVLAIRGVQRNARMASNRAAAVTMSQTFNNYNAAGASPALTAAPASTPNGIWQETLPALISGGDPLDFSVALNSSPRFNQVFNWISFQAGAVGGGIWIVDPDADFDIAAAQ